MLEGLTFRTDAMYAGALGGYMNATDAADWLVKKGVAFRDAHEIIGKLVLYAIGKQIPLEKLTLEELKAASDIFDQTVYEAISVEACVNARDLPGGPGELAVLEAIVKAETWLRKCEG